LIKVIWNSCKIFREIRINGGKSLRICIDQMAYIRKVNSINLGRDSIN